MKFRVFGKYLKNEYKICNGKKSVRENGVTTEVFVKKPYYQCATVTKGHEEILTFEADCMLTNAGTRYSLGYYDSINISEEEDVKIEKRVFRADLSETHLFTDKILGTDDSEKEKVEEAVDKLVKDFNKTMIKSNDKLRAYCDVHHLSYANTDCLELFKLVYPNKEWKIIDGRLVEMIEATTSAVEVDYTAIAAITPMMDAYSTKANFHL